MVEKHIGLVVQSIISLTKFVRYFSTHKSKCANIFAEKMRRAFALLKLLMFFCSKNGSVYTYNTFEVITY